MRTMECVRLWCMVTAASLVAAESAWSAETAKPVANTTYQFVADEMCCKGCAKNIAAQLYAAPGVTNVQADVATRTVVVTAKPSPKLTLEKLWDAVEKGKGKPSKLTTTAAIYELTRLEELTAEERPTAGVYTLVVSEMSDKAVAAKIAKSLYAIEGVQSVSFDSQQQALIVRPANGVQLSPWKLGGAVEQAEAQPLVITGPHGRFTIERMAEPETLSSRSNNRGEVR
ncbi:MAG: heavy-metal-associated domain-containing protein [Pirellulales bacterium]